MRRFATFVGLASLVAACGGGDITVKTDLNEAFTIKNSTVETTEYSPEARIGDLINRKNDAFRQIKEMQRTYDCDSLTYVRQRCYEIESAKVENRQSLIAIYDDYIQTLKEAEIAASPAAKIVKYRAVFTDLNGKKSAMPYRLLHCISPKISSSKTSELAEAMGLADSMIKANSSKASDLAALKVCQKYAFKSTRALSSQTI